MYSYDGLNKILKEKNIKKEKEYRILALFLSIIRLKYKYDIRRLLHI